ncbi:MAG: hypothetical protein U0Q14_10170 [Dermatophilaceae bacterium]
MTDPRQPLETAPVTGNEAVDEAIRVLEATDPSDLDATLAAGRQVLHVLNGQLDLLDRT